MITRTCSSSGFTLLEAMIGVILAACVVVGALTLSRNSLRSNSQTQDMARAASVLGSFLEEIRGANLDALQRNVEVTETVGEYQLSWKAFDESSVGTYKQPAGLVQICAKVVYQRQGRPHQQATSILLGRP